MKNSISLFGIWGLMLVLGCFCKPKTPHLREEYITQEFKDYAYFKDGTRWIYYDSTTNTYDSVEVYESYNRVDTLIDFDNNTCYFETVGYKEKHSADNSVIHNYYDYSPFAYAPNSNNIDNLHSERVVHFVINQSNGPAISFYTPLILDSKNYINDEDSIYIDSILSSMQLRGKIYGNTIKLFDSNNKLWLPYYFNNYCKMHSITYWSRNVGITRRILQSDSLNRDWKLIQYEIIQ